LSSHRQPNKLIVRTLEYTELAMPITLNVLSHRERMQLTAAWDRREEDGAIEECLSIATIGHEVEDLLDTFTTREIYQIIAAAFTAASLSDEERKKSLSSLTASTEKSAEAASGDSATSESA